MRIRSYVFITSLACIFAVAIFLRFFNFHDTIAFRSDQASDLYIARSIVEQGNTPLSGPLLSVQNFSTPPTYYYILAALYAVFRTPEGVTIAFAVGNLVAMYIMVRIAVLLMDRTAGVILALLLATSSIMVFESRTMWQPNPLTLCIAASLWCLLAAFHKRSTTSLFMSLLLYMFALSIYIAAIILLPFYLYSSIKFFHKTYKKPVGAACVWAVIIVTIAGIPFFGSFFIYEFTHGFPTYHVLGTPALRLPPSIQGSVDLYIRYIQAFIYDIFRPPFLQAGRSPFVIYLLDAMVVLCMILPFGTVRFMSDKFRGMIVNVRQFLSVPSLFIGLCFALLFQQVNSYRIHALVPFFFLWFALAMRLAISSRRIIALCLTAVLVTVYVISNTAGIWQEQITYGGHNIPNALAVASFIGQDNARLGLQNGQMDVLSYRPDSYSNYSLFPYLYYLRDTAHYAIEFVPLGNDVNRARLNHPGTAYVYLLCTSSDRDWIRDGCDGYFESENPEYHADRQKQFSGETTLTVYTRAAVNRN